MDHCKKFRNSNLVLFLSLLCAVLQIVNCDLPSDIKKCKAGDVECMRHAIGDILRLYPKGNKEFGLTASDEFNIREIHLSEASNSGPVQIDFIFSNGTATGVDKFMVSKMVGFEEDPLKSKFEVYGTVPNIRLKGHYETKGRVLLLPLVGKGNADILLTNSKVVVKVKVDVEVRNGKHYLILKKFKCTLDPEKMTVQLDNLFNGNKELGDSMNSVINENWREIYTEMGPGINRFISDYVKGLIENVLKVLSYDDFYAK